METIEIGTSGIAASRVGLDTEAIGGWVWGGSTGDLERAMSTIPSAIERGITFIHTAPVYGFGLSERIVGVRLSGGLRERAIIATQTGLEWRDGKVRSVHAGFASPAAGAEHVRLKAEIRELIERLLIEPS